MSHIEIYRIKGREYRYEVTNYRVNGKVKHKKKYLGPVIPIRKRKKGGGRNPYLFVKKLNDKEVKMLTKSLKSHDRFIVERAKTVLFSSQGKTVREICGMLQKEKKSIIKAIKEFNEKGLKALQRRASPGRKPKFTIEQKAEILSVVSTEPRKLGLHFTTWSLPRIKKYLTDEKIVDSICIESIRNILLSQGLKYSHSKRWQYSNDPDFKKNFGLMN